MTATGKASRFPRSFGALWRDGLPGLPVVVGLSGTLGELERDPDEVVSASFEIVRTGYTSPSCSVDWRVEGTGGNPAQPEHFSGGVYPEGVAAFAPTATVVPGTISLSVGAAPPTALTGRVVLFDPDKCRIAEGHAELPFSIAAGAVTVGDAIVTLVVPFDVLDPEALEPPPPLLTTYSYALNLVGHRVVPGSDGADLWPSTWASNGVYTTFGDGPGGTSASGYVSLGLARFTGTTVADLAISYLVGGSGSTDHWPTLTGYNSANSELNAKCTSLIAYGSNLYLWLADDDGNRGWDDCRIGKVAIGSIAAGPTVPSWGTGQEHTWKTINPTWLQCGQDFGLAFDSYVYAFPQHYAPIENPGDSPSHNPAQFYLIRCLRAADWQVQANWQWWTGGSDSAPTWGADADRQARITMTGQCDWRGSAFYIGGSVDRCVFRIGRTGNPTYGGGSMSRFATFTAQRPWHAWTMIADQQYTTPGLDPDLAQIAPLPHTLAIDGAGKATWIDTLWGGDNTDCCIVAQSTLTPGEASTGYGLDDFAGNYVMHRDHTGGGVTQRSAGIDLTGGTSGSGDQENCVAMFSRTQWSGNFTLAFDVTKLDNEAPKTGQSELFLLLLFNLSGVSPKPADLADWPSDTNAGSHTYRDQCRGGRIALYFQTTADPGQDKLPSAAVFNEGATSVAGTPTTAFEQRRDVTYHYTVTKAGSVVTVAQTGGSAARSATYDDAGFASFAAAGNLGFQVTAGRKVRIENLTISGGP